MFSEMKTVYVFIECCIFYIFTLLEKIPFRVPRPNLRIKASFIVPRARTNVLAGSPLNRILKLGNLLEDEVDLFKCSIKEVTEAVVVCLE
jgi:hypothetical protein